MAENKIRILPDEISNKIAAGEVVERPASVVKELVENAIDANARYIIIKVSEAGKALLSVADDGSGMSRDDLLLAVKRHATSKIAQVEDLDTIGTLGFRGEALPSIASVSRLTITTSTGGGEGTRLVIHGGETVECATAAGPKGTTVEMEDLFYNVPARKKFLKSTATELRNIVDTITRLALIHPQVGFDVSSEGKKILNLPPGQSLKDRAEELLGNQKLYWWDVNEGGRTLKVAYANPHEGRGRADGIKLFVNRRAVSDRLLFRALTDGFKGAVVPGQYPTALLWIDLPPAEVDVNVHPAKREVRFSDENFIFRWVMGSVAEAVSSGPWLSGQREVPEPSSDFEVPNYARRVEGAVESFSRREYQPGGYNPSLRQYRPTAVPLAGLYSPPDEKPVQEPGVWATPFGELRYIGQFLSTYIVFEDAKAGELVLMDQHAAHERVLFEKILGRERAKSSQPLLVPVIIDLTPTQAVIFAEREGLLADLGVVTEPFGPRCVSVVSAPAELYANEIVALVQSALEEDLADLNADREDRLKEICARAACSDAVKAKSALEPSEVRELVKSMNGLENPTNCPHGRPVVVRLTVAKLESLFLRR